eukprot:8431366-Alexandrium_andersonii.AAC.2
MARAAVVTGVLARSSGGPTAGTAIAVDAVPRPAARLAPSASASCCRQPAGRGAGRTGERARERGLPSTRRGVQTATTGRRQLF